MSATGPLSPVELPPVVLAHSAVLGRVVRQDSPATIGVSTLTLFERAVATRRAALAGELLVYFRDEVLRIDEALHTWMHDVLAYRLEASGAGDAQVPGWLLRGPRGFDPAGGELDRALDRLQAGDGDGALTAAERLRLRCVTWHDALVAWMQDLLHGLADALGEQAVFDAVARAHERLWRPRYAAWETMTPEERLQLSVEGMRGHLSGPGRRGDVGVLDEADRYVMVLDPCGSCGVLRRGDPDSGRAPLEPAGNRTPHPWTWGRTGVSWYAVHSPIVMEYLWLRAGKPPMRPLEACDTQWACRWFIYKDPAATRPEHYERMGFPPPVTR